jgi:parvulin-like peptidyl-prolyl isomerase
MKNRLLLASALLLLAAPCLANVLVVEELIAKVNGDIITRSDYEQSLAEGAASLEAQKDLSEADRQQFLKETQQNALRNLIDERLLIQRGKDLNLNVEAQVLRQRDEIMKRYEIKSVEEFDRWASEKFNIPAEDLMEQLRSNVLSQMVLGQEVGSKIVVPRPDIEKYYVEHKDEFQRSEGVRLREILISTEGKTGDELAAAERKAKDALQRVQRGEPFAEIARRLSENPTSAPNGGDIGVFRKGQLKKEMEDEVFSHEEGYITDLIKIPNGYLILKVDQRFREGLAEFEEVEGEIQNRLAGPMWNPAVRDYLSGLRRDAYIEIRPGYLDSGAVPGMDTSWSDPAKLAPVTTTKEELLNKKKKRRLLWLIPLPGGGDKSKEGATTPPAADSQPSESEPAESSNNQ